MTHLRTLDFICDRLERGETPEEIAESEGVSVAQVEAVMALADSDSSIGAELLEVLEEGEDPDA